MTFLEAALEILKREGRPLHFKELTERAMTKKLLTFVGRTPEVTMQTQLTSAIKKAPGNPFVRVKPGVFGLLRYPEMPPEEKEAAPVEAPRRAAAGDAGRGASGATADDRKRDRPEKAAAPGDAEGDGRGRRRRRRGGRGRGGTKPGEGAETPGAIEATATARAAVGDDHDGPDDAIEEPTTRGLSAEARAAALAETGVLEGDDDDDVLSADADEDGPPDATAGSAGAADHGPASGSADGGGPDGDEGDDGDDVFGSAEPAADAAAGSADELGRRRRRRRRRRRGGEGEGGSAGTEERSAFGDAGGPSGSAGARPAMNARVVGAAADQEGSDGGEGTAELGAVSGAEGSTMGGGDGGGESRPAGSTSSASLSEAGGDAGQAARKITTPVDAAIEILRAQPPGRGVHVRQLADSAIRRRLIHGEPNEAWRVIRTALATEPKDRLRNGMRPRVRSAGSGLFALARRTPDPELEKAEQIFGEARRALRERTMAALERRLAELPAGAFEALARVLLQREGFGPTTFVKRVDGTIYVEALRGRGSRPSKCLIALRPSGSAAGRRAIGELRAGIRARAHDEGLLMLAGRLAEDAIAEWKQPGAPLEIADGAALAETCARYGVGVLSATVAVDFVDADFFAELAEG